MRPLKLHATGLLASAAWTGWTAVGLAFIAGTSAALVAFLGVASLLTGAWLTLRAPLSGLCLLPMAMMMGPAVALPVSGAGSVTIGDLYALMLVVCVYSPRLAKPTLPRNPYLVCAALLLLASTLSSNDLVASSIGLAKIVEFALLVGATMLLVHSAKQWRSIFTAWAFATTVGSVMMLWFLYRGQPHFLLQWAQGADVDAATVDVEHADTLFRPAFFYTNFFIPLGLTVIYALITLLTESEPSRARRLLLVGSALVSAVTLILNNTRSMLVPVLVVSGVILLLFIWKSILHARTRMLRALLVLSVVGAGVYLVAAFLISESQVTALLTRSGDSSQVTLRMSVWTSALRNIADHPARLLLFGWGPEATTRQSGDTLEMLRTGTLGNFEGAFDSTIVGFLVEYGLAFTFLTCSYAAIWWLRTARHYRRARDPLVLAMLVMSTALIFTLVFQQFGVSPPSLLALQLLVFAPQAQASMPVRQPHAGASMGAHELASERR